MRIVWKESNPKTKHDGSFRYRNHIISQYENGWITDLPGDINIYMPRASALNAIDKALGGKTRKRDPKRHKMGIKIVGRKDVNSENVTKYF